MRYYEDMTKKVAALIYGNKPHYLDHLAPLCYFLNIPLITNVEKIAQWAKKYYPDIQTIYIDNLDINIYVTKNFDTILSCITKEMFDCDFRFHQDLLCKEIKIIWCPHGNSDKGKTCFFFECLKNEKQVLIYGQKMLDILEEKKVLKTIGSYIQIGNYRYAYFLKFKKKFQKIVNDEIQSKIKNNNPTILYAPTWEDIEKTSSFNKYACDLLENSPSNINLIVKVHPNLLSTDEIKIEILKSKYKKNSILFLEDFPLIYPLLDFVDVYLGDFSSIGYDFLIFNKPMFFFPPENSKLKSTLFESGHIIENRKIFETIKNHIENDFIYKRKREKLYNYTFEKKTDIKTLKKFIYN